MLALETLVPLLRLILPETESVSCARMVDEDRSSVSSMRMISMVVELAVAPAPSKTLTFHSQVP